MSNNTPQEVLGIIIQEQEVGNMKINHIHVSDFAIQTILKTISLSEKAQFEAVDKLVDRTPEWTSLKQEVQMDRIKIILTQETVIEYLRYNEDIKEDVSMIETGIDEEGSIIVTAYYIQEDEATNNILGQDPLTEEQVNEMERSFNVVTSQINVVEEAKKRLEQMKQGKVTSLTEHRNRKERRAIAKQIKK